MRIKKSTVFLTMFVLLLAFTGCQNESSSTDENKQTKSTASDKVIYNQKDLQNPQKLEISEDGTVEMEIKSMTEPDNILPENKSIFLLHQRKIQMFLCNILMIHMEKRGHCFVAN